MLASCHAMIVPLADTVIGSMSSRGDVTVTVRAGVPNDAREAGLATAPASSPAPPRNAHMAKAAVPARTTTLTTAPNARGCLIALSLMLCMFR
jgi:hypothetical protein